MKKYRKRPVVVEAMRLLPNNTDEAIEFLKDFLVKFTDDGALVETLEGLMLVKWGNYIIKGIAGEFYPCDAEIFQQTYEEVRE